jgi:hypothetical protein
MRTYIAVTTLITMLAASAAFARDRAAAPIGVYQIAAAGGPTDDGIQATWAVQSSTSQKALSLMQTSVTPSAGVALIAARGGGGSMHGGAIRGGAIRGGAIHGGMGSFHGSMGSMPGHDGFRRDFDRGFHRDFDRGFHRDFHRDFDLHLGLGFGFGYYPYGGYGYCYPYSYYYPYGYYYGCWNPWYYYPYFGW